VVAADICESRETADTWHVEVQKQQVRFGVGFDNDLQGVEAVRFDDVSVVDAVADRMD
jgi:hypothetical protein